MNEKQAYEERCWESTGKRYYSNREKKILTGIKQSVWEEKQNGTTEERC